MDRSITKTVIKSCYRPFLLLTLEPLCLNLCLFSAILLGILFLCFGAFEVVFGENHGFELWQIGLTFIGLLFGQLVSISTVPWWNSNYLRLVKHGSKFGGKPGVSAPEYRLPRRTGSVRVILVRPTFTRLLERSTDFPIKGLLSRHIHQFM